MLPKGKIDNRTITLSGGDVQIRGLTLAESRLAGTLTGEESIATAISFATGEPKADVIEWMGSAPAGDVTTLLTAISEVSGLTKDAQFQK